MKARFMRLEDGNEVLQITLNDDFGPITVLEPSRKSTCGTYGIVVCTRDSQCDLITGVVEKLDAGISAIGAPIVDGVSISLSELPESMATLSDLSQIAKDRYDGELADCLIRKLERFMSLKASNDVFTMSPFLMDTVYGIISSVPSMPQSFKDGVSKGEWPANSYMPDEAFNDCLEYCTMFENSEVLKQLFELCFRPVEGE